MTILRLCVNWPLQTMVTVPDYRSNSNPLPACSHGEKLWFRKEFQLHGGTASFYGMHFKVNCASIHLGDLSIKVFLSS